MRVALAAEHAIGVKVLTLLLDGPWELRMLLTSGTEAAPSQLATVARRRGVPVLPAARVRDPGFGRTLREEGIDLLLNAHSLHIAAEEVVAAPRIGSFNLHPGPLPEYAGLHPVSWALVHGERRHGVTLHWMDATIDTGAVAYRRDFAIGATDSALAVTARCTTVGLELVAELLRAATHAPASIPRRAQDRRRRRYFGGSPPYGGRAPWHLEARAIANFVRACDYLPFRSPWGFPRSDCDGEEIGVARAVPSGVPCHGAAPGTVARVEAGVATVATGDEWLAVERIVRGAKVESAASLRAGARFVG